MLGFAGILAPTDLDTFFGAYWEQRPLIIRRDEPRYYNTLLALADVDHIVSSTGLKHPDLRMVKDAVPLPPQQYTRPNSRGESAADVDKILAEYGRGATIILDTLHERWKPLAYLCRDLEQRLNHPVQANVYLTPRSAQGFAPHYDTHDVFVLQVHGAKHWRIYNAAVHLPDRSLPHRTERDKLGAPLHELDVGAGDLIYLPRGFVHEALTSAEESLHLTVGVLAYSWFDVFQEVLAARREQDWRFRDSLPPGFATRPQLDPALRDRFRELAAALASDSAVDSAIEKLAARFVSGRRPLLDGALSRFYVRDALTVDSAVERRTNIIFRITRDHDAVTLAFGGKQIQLPDYVEPSLRYIAAATRFTVREIPGEIDDAARLVLVRSLLREGFLTLDS